MSIEYPHMKAIIPTGGRGTRMRPVTFSANKHFMPVANKPLIFYPIETIADVGIKDILITYNPGFLEAIKSLLGNGSKWGVKFTFVLQEEPKGLANIIEVCEKDLKGSSFVFHLGDNIFVDGIQKQIDYFKAKKPNALVTMIKVNKGENKRMGVPFFHANGKLREYFEKPKNPPNNFGITGLYFFDNNVFKCFKGKDKVKPSKRGELEIGSLYNWMIKNDYRVDVDEYEGKWLDPGKFSDWLESNMYLLDRKIMNGKSPKTSGKVKIEGRVSFGKNVKIKNAKIRGPVVIGDNVVIENSYIGPYTSVYHNCNLVNCRVENTILMEEVEIKGINRLIDASIIGPQSKITTHNHGGDQIEVFLGAQSEVII